MMGRYADGYLQFIYEINVSYTNDIAGTPSEVSYSIKSEISKEGRGYLERSRDGKKLIVSRDKKNRTKLIVSGTIKQNMPDGKFKVTDLSDIVIASDGDIFSSWLLSRNSNFHTTKIADAKSLPRSPVEFGDPSRKVDGGAAVSLFKIQDDFKLVLSSSAKN